MFLSGITSSKRFLTKTPFSTDYPHILCRTAWARGKAPRGTTKKGAGSQIWMSPYQKSGPVATTLGKGVQGGEAPLWHIICVHISSFRFAIVERSGPVECIMNSSEKSMQLGKLRSDIP